MHMAHVCILSSSGGGPRDDRTGVSTRIAESGIHPRQHATSVAWVPVFRIVDDVAYLFTSSIRKSVASLVRMLDRIWTTSRFSSGELSLRKISTSPFAELAACME